MTTNPLHPSPALLEKLVGVIHAAIHEVEPYGPTGRLCRDPEVIAWSRAMRELGLLPDLPRGSR